MSDAEQKRRPFRALVIDDDKEMRLSLSHLLEAAGWRVELLSSIAQVEQKLNQWQPDVILSDVRMPGGSGLDLLHLEQQTPPIVLISAHGDIPMAVEAMRAGAYSFLEKPFDPQRLLRILNNAAERHRLTQNTQRLQERLAKLSGIDRVLLGQSPQLQTVREQIIDFSSTPAPVLISGETGTGKELVARAIHDLSDRADQPFIAMNCATFEAGSFERMVFGVQNESLGTFMQAEGGTLFLDEVASLGPDIQAKLLRAIEHHEITPIGSDKPQSVDVRIVSASNENLNDAIAASRFREDLFYRLSTVVIDLPNLRSRRDDIVLLMQHFLSHYAALYETTAPQLDAEEIATLLAHDWPGNVRELRNVAERRVLAARRGGGSISTSMRLENDMGNVPETLREAVASFERSLIAKAIQTHQGRMDAVAEALGIGRRTLNEKIVKLNLDKSELL